MATNVSAAPHPRSWGPPKFCDALEKIWYESEVLGPLNTFVHREILPRARKRGIPVHVISAIGDPRSQPRTPEWAAEQLDLVRAGGLNGLNLYEIWVYLRTTPRGEWFRRGCSAAVFARLHERL